ncbi:MAG: hypothetical protein CMJ19_09150 [Phycisphaeraceae bacterium]|nr:hypothetical protein [Phycisphaeraceae bacterium]
MTRHDQDNPMDAFEDLLSEALSPDMPSDDLAARIIARTSADTASQADAPQLKLVGAQQVASPVDDELEPMLDEALTPPPVPHGLVKRIVAATRPVGDHVIARIGPLRLRYNMARYIAAAVIIAASWGIVFQAMGICTDAFHIVQATHHVSSIMKYSAPDTDIDQEIDQLANQVDKLALGTNNEDWSTRVGEMSDSLLGLEKMIESDTSDQTMF